MQNKFISISKLDAAKRELEHAIRLFFYNGDLVVIHLVASSSQEILRDIGLKSGAYSIIDRGLPYIKKTNIKSFVAY